VAESDELAVVLTTFAVEDDAARIVRELVDRRLVACGNLMTGARSIYRWRGRVEDAGEVLCLLKTRVDRLPELTRVLTELHPYEAPEIVALPIVGGGRGYRDWVAAEASSASK